ncbi:hypothetical protein TIFTF001_005312 [Ficus carica]|uniref:Calcium uniporter protein n=1 Tax=Ficus carica TaxID=3494 RepID=A0AA87ZEH7_FICCA|nr:hypothetical protein TIFTF001_005312 [Ficus carica]
MALRKMLAKRLLDGRRETSRPVTLQHSPITSSPPFQTDFPATAAKESCPREYLTSPDSSDKGFFRRLLHRRAQYQSAAKLPEFLTQPVGEKLRENLRVTDITSDRLRLDSLSPPAPEPAAGYFLFGLSVSDARKILKLAQVGKLKAKLGEIPESSISYSEFFRICVESCENEEQGAEFAKIMDEWGNFTVLGNVVYLRPEQV